MYWGSSNILTYSVLITRNNFILCTSLTLPLFVCDDHPFKDFFKLNKTYSLTAIFCHSLSTNPTAKLSFIEKNKKQITKKKCSG